MTVTGGSFRMERQGAIPVRPGDPACRGTIVGIRTGNVLPAVFCVHPSTGGVGEFVGLARRLGPGRQFYGLRARGLAEGEQPLRTVGEMAAAYLEDVARVQPEGPYLFAAWSMGCYVAVEMARRVAAAGGRVGGVFLMAPPYDAPRGRLRLRAEWKATRGFLAELEGRLGSLTAAARAGAAGGRELLPLWDLSDDPLPDPDQVAGAVAGPGERQRLRGEIVNLVGLWAGLRYRMAARRARDRYDGRVVLFVPQDDPEELRGDTVAQWRGMLRREPDVVPVPGRHRSIVHGAPAEAVAARLRAEIARFGPDTGAAP